MSWALDNACLFVLGCTNLIIVIDLRIYKDRELNTIPNHRLQYLKEKTLAYCFTIYTIGLGSGTKDQMQFSTIQFTKSYPLTIHLHRKI